MTILALGRGFAAIFRPRLVAAFYALGVLLAVFVAVPFGVALDGAVKRLPDPAVKAAALAPPWFDDFRRSRAPALAALGDGAAVATWGYVLCSTILAGGVIRSFDQRAAERRRAEGLRWSYRDFLADSGQHVFRMLRVLVVAILLASLLDFVFNDLLADVHDRYLSRIESEKLSVVTEWARQGLFLLALLGLATWLDYGRATVVIERRRSVLAALVAAADELLHRPLRAAVVAGTFVVLELAFMAGGSVLLAEVRTDSWRALALWFVLAQVLVVLRIGLGLGRLAAVTTFVEEARDDREEPVRLPSVS